MELLEFTLPCYLTCYLIYGDHSGLSDEDKTEIDSFLEKKGAGWCASVSEDSWFSWRNDMNYMGNDVCVYKFFRLAV